ncbi:MAG: hypothetical protein GEU88_02975 [Solirubrobacterales bacterium]|nr:hypothetical protein [Solirubrobacterales bacterium]
MRKRRRPESRRRRATLRRRRLGAAAVALLAAAAFGGGAILAGNGGASGGADDAAAAALPQLPRGGRDLLPDYRLVAFYGAPQSRELGALGIGTPRRASARLLEQARAYREGDRPVMPVLELLASIAASDPGDDGSYRLRQPHAVIRRYLAEARRRRALLLLDVQPGAADFADEIARLRPYLREPDVGLALDPEWHVGPGEVPGQVIGSVDAATVNEISARLAALVERRRLPEKLFVVHQFTAGMIARRGELEARPGLATVINVDGFGDRANKVAKYRDLRPHRGARLHSGFKLFYGEDLGLMKPEEVLRLRPAPELIVYE